MSESALIAENPTNRELVRQLRAGANRPHPDIMPESQLWQLYTQLRQRGVPQADALFIDSLRALFRRRCVRGTDFSMADAMPEEHRLVDDRFLADLWKAYKKCIRHNRTGPAAQLLRDIEEQVSG